MAHYSSERSLGARVAAARRARGYRTLKELAAALEGTGLTASILQNIELDRRANIDISHVLNLARTLEVPVSYLLAPMARPGDIVDLPNLGASFKNMTASEFDAWLSAIPNASYTAGSAAERTDRAELQALRELQTARRELYRLEAIAGMEEFGDESEALREDSRMKRAQLRSRIDGLQKFLASDGWEV
ncbi:MAG TPA: helix-turn-helix domain-containing protein [Pseudolysinimonas sp.]|nr:helix-turn-helix domain-containing protein [Pseudolysinimonas sp.]